MASETGHPSQNPRASQNVTRPSRAEVFDAVKNLRRRYVLYYLQRHDGPVELGELAEQVAAWENDATVAEVSPSERKSVYSALHQTHLPKLQAAGVVEYDADRSLVATSDQATRLDLRLASDPHTSVPWHRLYLSLAGVSLVVLVSLWQGVHPFALISGVEFALLVIASFGLAALGHTYDLRRWRRRAEHAAPDFILELDD
ncbi:hypothetical protein NGM10_04620 [Halorussus salilacus]|uniref:DUF7344 domain-containing protein n=1 Tax=Halorussus salilacus TaxID=2953750 RepID=UPI0020A198C8|nr:hypothetical protein [Halorussus salilacus]USZ69023.1 hypothetical protein NGM10_04620 [Halorussus salilacus]